METLLTHTDKQVLWIRLNRPHRLNAVTEQLYLELDQVLNEASQNKDIRCLVITGQGRAFCAGADLKEHASGARTAFERRAYLRGEQQVCKRILSIKKPVIAAVNGFAIGAGAEIALAADFLLMAESAKIALPEVSIGSFLGGGVTHTLPRLVGLAKARELIFLGEKIDAADAVEMGLANRRYADSEFESKVSVFAEKLSGKAPLSVSLAKEHLNQSADQSLDSILQAELEAMCFCATTKDWQEGIDAFAEKREPMFNGT